MDQKLFQVFYAVRSSMRSDSNISCSHNRLIFTIHGSDQPFPNILLGNCWQWTERWELLTAEQVTALGSMVASFHETALWPPFVPSDLSWQFPLFWPDTIRYTQKNPESNLLIVSDSRLFCMYLHGTYTFTTCPRSFGTYGSFRSSRWPFQTFLRRSHGSLRRFGLCYCFRSRGSGGLVHGLLVLSSPQPTPYLFSL